MAVTTGQLESKIDGLLALIGSDSRYAPQAIQFVEYHRPSKGSLPCPTGKESPVYGGAWDCYLNAYAEGIACNAIRYKVNAKQFRILEKAAQGKVHHILVK